MAKTKNYSVKIEPTATALILNSKGNVLLIKRTKQPWKGLWGFPGGHVDAGETPRKTILREVREETGLVVSAGKKPLEVFIYPVLDHYHRSHVFRCRLKGSPKFNPSPEWAHEGTLKWCRPGQRGVNPVVKYVLEKYAAFA
jgi:8-oxo-dGTP pyrophosphatase MutT (NUDIX family)